QPLFVPDLKVAGKGTHDALVVATTNNTLYAFDANDGSPLWQVNLGPGGTPPTNNDVGSNCNPYRDFSGRIGIVGTPVIDPASGTLYVVARTKEPKFVQGLHAIDLSDGSERSGSPVVIAATAGNLSFDAQLGNQRAGLLLSGGAVTIAWSSHCDSGQYH